MYNCLLLTPPSGLTGVTPKPPPNDTVAGKKCLLRRKPLFLELLVCLTSQLHVLVCTDVVFI